MLDRLLTSQVTESGVGLVRQESYTYGPTGNILSVTLWPQTTHLGYRAAAGSAVTPTITGRGSVTGLSGGAARLGFTQNGALSVPLGGTWVSASYYYSDSEHVHAATGLSSGASFDYDDNGNMIGRSEGGRTYAQTFDAENRLVSVVQAGVGTTQYIYRCNGLSIGQGGAVGCESDRVSQTVNGVTTNYVLDLAGGLTQVLAEATDGVTTTYLYGNGRIAQYDGSAFDYFLPDALGSVRQLADESGEVTLARRYGPYGDVIESAGAGTTGYGFTGEDFQSSVGLLYLRARFLQPDTGRFITRDSWPGDVLRPMSHNLWQYAFSDPVNLTDPSGHRVCEFECPGDYVDPFQAQFGSAWYGPWDIEQQRQNAAAVESVLVGGLEIVASIACEPIDWVLTARDCATGDCSPWVLLGLLPVIPGHAGRFVSNVVPTGLLRQGDEWIRYGQWARRAESMSETARAYQRYITGAEDSWVFVRNGVNFDGVKFTADGTLALLDAKGPHYARFVKDGRFLSWFTGSSDMLVRARKQLAAAEGMPIEWHVAEVEAADAIRTLLRENGYAAIEVIHVP